jgi:3-hydroxy-3-methylglutaryl CoA synthase
MPEEAAAILAVAARVPPFTLAAETVDRAYGRPPGRGGRRFAAYDEDALTLAAAAGERCLEGFDRSTLKALYVASTTWPRAAAAQAERLAMALDLPDTVEVATFGGSGAVAFVCVIRRM